MVTLIGMSDVTQILEQIEEGDGVAAERLLPLIYDELKRLAAAECTRKVREILFRPPRLFTKRTCGSSTSSERKTGEVAVTFTPRRPRR